MDTSLFSFHVVGADWILPLTKACMERCYKNSQEQSAAWSFKGFSMKRNLIALGGVILRAGLAACTTPKDAQELSQKTVEYRLARW